MNQSVELLAPARDVDCAQAAVDCGADAIYVGASQYGAREMAGNSLEDIERILSYAHPFFVRVYVTLNTLLFDRELDAAVKLIHQLYDLGVDGVIIQDMGLLECDLPPIPLIASTQTHNTTPEKVSFLEQVGFQRVILARELSLDEIKAIRAETKVELECFVHGAICVSYSGQCYLSYVMGGRSGNRGCCAQPCRKSYSLVDADGHVLTKDRYLLSLKDLNLSEHLGDLLDAGVRSFKIEGRLKGVDYVANVVGWYRQQLDEFLTERGFDSASSGKVTLGFEPDLQKVFNRGFTDYFMGGGRTSPGSLDTPKQMGPLQGNVTRCDDRSFCLDRDSDLRAGDGICFVNRENTLQGTQIHAVNGVNIFPDRMMGIKPGVAVYRNRDHAFERLLAQAKPCRQILVSMRLEAIPGGLRLIVTDEDGITGQARCEIPHNPAEQPEAALQRTKKQLQKTGSTIFSCKEVEVVWEEPLFVQVSILNGLRRDVLMSLQAKRWEERPVRKNKLSCNTIPYPETCLSYTGNVLNKQAEAFYRRHGVTQIEQGAESGRDLQGETVMTTRYCIRMQMGLCSRDTGEAAVPLYLVDEQGQRLELIFDCKHCCMTVRKI